MAIKMNANKLAALVAAAKIRYFQESLRLSKTDAVALATAKAKGVV